MKDFNVRVNFGATGTGQASAGARAVATSIQEVETTARSVMSTLAGMAASFGAAFSFSAAVKAGIEFNRTIEDTRIGIAGILGVYRDYVDAQGQVVTGTAAFNAAQIEAAELQKDLAAAALSTTASYTEMVEAFQVAVGPMTTAGVKMEQTVDLTQRLTQAMGALGIPMAQLGIEMRQFMRGDEMRSALMQRLGITREMIEQWKKSGTLFQEVMKRTESIGLAADAASRSFSGGLSNLKDAFQQFMGTAFKGLYEEAKQTVFDIQKLFVTIVPKKGGGFTVEFNQTFLEVVIVAADAMETVVSIVKGAAVSIFESLSSGVKSSGGGWKEFFQVVALGLSALVETLAYVGKAIALYLAHPVESTKTLFKSVFAFILSAANDLVQAIAGILKPLASIDERLYAPIKEAAAGSQAFLDQFLLDLEKRLPNAIDGSYANTQKLFEQFAFGEGRTEKLSDKLRALLKHLADQMKAEEAAKAHAKLVKELEKAWQAAERYMDQLASLRDQAPTIFAKLEDAIGDPVEAARLKVQAEFKALSDDVTKLLTNGIITPEKAAAYYAALDAGLVKATKKAIDAVRGEWNKIPGLFQKALRMPTLSEQDWIEKLPEDMREIARKSIAAGKDIGEAWSQVIASLMEQGRGMEAGWLEIMRRIPSAAESAARYTQNAWAALTRGLDDSLFAVLTGKAEDLGDVLKGVGEDLTRNVTGWVTDMIQRLLAGTATLKEEWQSYVAMVKSRNAMQIGGDAATGGMLGYGLGSATGDKGTTITSTFFGAVGGMIGGQLGALIGSIVGLIIGGLLKKENDLRIGQYLLPYGTSQYGAGVSEWGYGGAGAQWDYAETGGGPKQRYWDIGFGPRSPQDPWDSDTATRGIPHGMASSLRKVTEAWVSSFANLFGTADPSTRALFTKELNEQIKKYMETFDVRLHAGTDEELQGVAKDFLEKFLPTQYLAMAFGRTTALPDMAGIKVYEGLDTVTGAAGKLWDPDAPIPRMLAGLGVTAKKIEEIAGMVGIEDPQDIMAYLQDLVGILVGFRDLSTELGKTAAQVWADYDEARKKPLAARFGDWAENLAGLAEDLSSYTGTEQREKAKELIALGQQYLQSQREALLAIKQLAEDVAASVQDLLDRMTTALMTAAERTARDRQTVFGTEDWGPAVVYGWQKKMYDATTPDQVKAAADEALAAAQRLFDEMLDDLNTALAVQSDINGLISEMRGETVKVSMTATSAVESWAAVTDIQRRAGEAAKLSGRAQIDAIAAVAKDARTLWESNRQMLQRLADYSKDLNKSIEQQIWEIDYSGMNPQQQAGAIKDRIEELRTRLLASTDPEEVRALSSEMQSLISRYLGLFGADDPNAQAARDWAKETLKIIQNTTQHAWDEMRDAIEAANASLVEIMEGLGPALQDTIDGLEAEVERLRGVVELIRESAEIQLGKMAQDIVDAGEGFEQAIKVATRLFTDLNDVLGTEPGTKGDEQDVTDGLTGSMQRASTGAEDLADAAGKAAAAQLRAKDSADALADAMNRLITAIETDGGGTARSAGGTGGVLELVRRAGPQVLFAKATGV